MESPPALVCIHRHKIEAVGREIVAGRHLTLPVGKESLQNLQLTATEGKTRHGSTIQGIYAPFMSLIMVMTQSGMCLDSRTTKSRISMHDGPKNQVCNFDFKCNANQSNKQGPIPITNSRNKACMQDAMQPRHTS